MKSALLLLAITTIFITHSESITKDSILQGQFENGANERRTLTFVLRLSPHVKGLVKAIQRNIVNFELTMDGDPTYIAAYNLILFKDQQIVSKMTLKKAEELVAVLNSVEPLLKNPSTCDDNVLKAAATATQFGEDLPESPIYVITDAVAKSVEDPVYLASVDGKRRSPVYIFLVPGQCKIPSNSSTEYKKLRRAGAMTNGEFFAFSKTVLAEKALFTHLSQTFYRSSLLLADEIPKKTAFGVTYSIDVDFTVTNLVTVFETTSYAFMNDPTGQGAELYPSSYGTYQIGSIGGPMVGTWSLQFYASSYADSSVRIYSQHFRRNGVKMSWNFKDKKGVSTTQPRTGSISALKASLSSFVATNGTQVEADLRVWTYNSYESTNVLLSSGRWNKNSGNQLAFTEFQCPNAGDLYPLTVRLGGYFGLYTQRAAFMFCDNYIECFNGGEFSYGKCICSGHWTGLQCDEPICQNGGTKTGKTCKCVSGFGGPTCEEHECDQQSHPEFSMDGRMFGLVVDTTIGNQGAIDVLSNKLAQIMRIIQAAAPKWFDRFVFVSVNSTGFGLEIGTDSLDEFLTSAGGLGVDDMTEGCTVPLYGGVFAAMSSERMIGPNSVILVVTHGIPSKNDIKVNKPKFTQLLGKTKPQVYYLHVNEIGKCDAPINSPEVESFRIAISEQGGNMFDEPQYSLGNFLNSYLQTLYSKQILVPPTLYNTDCSNSIWKVDVDYHMKNIYISYDAPYTAVGVYDPNGDVVLLADVFSGHTTIKRVNAVIPGIYTFELSSPAQGLVQIYGHSTFGAWAGFVENIASDKAAPQPTQKQINYVIAHAGTAESSGHITSADLVDVHTLKTTKTLPMSKRIHCAYEYFSTSFECSGGDYLVLIRGNDENMENFTRVVGTAMCQTS